MNTLKAEKRSMDVKAKRLRREGFVTGNLFGREIEGSIPLKFTKKEIEALLKNNNKGSQVMLELDGKTYDALIKEVDYNPLAHTVEEVDFQALVSNEMVHSVAEIILENEEKVIHQYAALFPGKIHSLKANGVILLFSAFTNTGRRLILLGPYFHRHGSGFLSFPVIITDLRICFPKINTNDQITNFIHIFSPLS